MDALDFENLHAATSAVDADIRIYVATQLSCDLHFRKFGPATLGLIETTISSQSDEMFRWAYCQLQELKKLMSKAPKYVKFALETLPTTLDDTYTRMLLGIGEMYHQQALTLLQWLAYARSPPTLGALVEVAIIDSTKGSSIDAENRGDFEDTLNIISELVAMRERRAPDDRSGSETESSVDDVSSVFKQRQDLLMFPLLEYAAQSWYYHATLQCDGEVSREVSFLQSDNARKTWLHVHNTEKLWQKPFETPSNNTGSALYYTNLLGLGAVLKNLLDKDADINAEGRYYGNAPQAASAGGHTGSAAATQQGCRRQGRGWRLRQRPSGCLSGRPHGDSAAAADIRVRCRVETKRLYDLSEGLKAR